MRAVKNKVIVKPIEHIKLPSGIYIGAKELENPIGEVVAVGAGKKGSRMVVKKGDSVIYRQNIGRRIDYEGQKLIVLEQTHIIAIQ